MKALHAGRESVEGRGTARRQTHDQQQLRGYLSGIFVPLHRTPGIPLYCADYRSSHSSAVPANKFADDIRLFDVNRPFA